MSYWAGKNAEKCVCLSGWEETEITQEQTQLSFLIGFIGLQASTSEETGKSEYSDCHLRIALGETDKCPFKYVIAMLVSLWRLIMIVCSQSIPLPDEDYRK